MCHLLKDKDFFYKVLQILRERAIFSRPIWQYAFYHKDDTSLMAEYLKLSSDSLGRSLGADFKSSLVSLTEQNTKSEVNFQNFMEYHPMVNSRVHTVGKHGMHSSLLNIEFK